MLEVPLPLLDAVRKFVFEQFFGKIYTDLVSDAGMEVTAVFWKFAKKLGLEVPVDSLEDKALFAPDQLLLARYRARYNIQELQPLSVAITYAAPPRPIHSEYLDEENLLVFFMAKRFMRIKLSVRDATRFSAQLDQAINEIFRDTQHELIHWAQKKILRGFDENENIEVTPGQSTDQAYVQQYFKSEKELQPLMVNAFFEIVEILGSEKKITEQEFQDFVRSSLTLRKVREQSPEQSMRGEKILRELLKEKGML